MKLMKKAVSLTMAVAVWAASFGGSGLASATASADTVHIWDGTADTSWFTNDKDTYEISTPEQLAGLAQLADKAAHEDRFRGITINLTSDIVLNDTTNWQKWVNDPPKNKWEPIGKTGNAVTGYNAFAGVFNGNGHTISGMYAVSSIPSNAGPFATLPDIGLFEYISGAVIGNLRIEKSVLLGNSNRSTGILAANSESCYIDSVEVKDVIIGVGECTGGIVGSIGQTKITALVANLILAAAGVFVNPLLYMDQMDEYKGTIINNCKVSNADFLCTKQYSTSYNNRIGAVAGRIMGGGIVNSVSENCTIDVDKNNSRRFGAMTGGKYYNDDYDYVIKNCYTHNFRITNKNAKQQDASLVTTLSKNEYLSQDLLNKLGKGFSSVPNGTPVITSLKGAALGERIITGDFDNNGKFELSDISAALQAYANDTALDYRTFKAADIDANGTISLSDVTALLRKYAN